MPVCYRFGTFLLDPDGRRLLRGQELVRITSKAFDVLVLLVEARDRVVSRNELLDRLWPDTAVEDNNLSQQVHRLRRVLSGDVGNGSPIATVAGRGFRFTAPVDTATPPEHWPVLAPRPGPAPDLAGAWPSAPDRLVGRDEDLGRLHVLLRREPFVTLTGPGGVGKTRLAMDVGWRMRDETGDGVFWIDLTRATRGEDLVPLAAEALGFADAGGRRAPIVRLREWLADRDCLLVLDNFEHVLDAAPLLLQLRSPASTLRFLVTSRAPLGVRGECEYPVPPLRWAPPAGDDADDAFRQSPAVRLFLDRYAAQAGSADPDALDPREVSALCARLDGLPLAIELAAARARLVPPADLLGRDRLTAFLPRALRDVPERQQSVVRSIEWSYALLDESDQRGLRVLGVFTGGFTPAAGAAVLMETGVAPGEASAYDALGRLRQHSLLAFDRADRASRLRVLETVREFCADLRPPAEDATARGAHAGWVLTTFEREAPGLRSGRHVLAMERLVADHANLLSALRWCATSGRLVTLGELAAASATFWHTANLFREGREWIDLAIDRLQQTEDVSETMRTRLLAASALMAFHACAWEDSRRRVDEVLAREPCGAATVLAACLDAGLTAYQGNPAAALPKSRSALAAAQALGEPWLEGLAGVFDGFAWSLSGNHEQAYQRLARTPRAIGFLDLLIDVNLALQALFVDRADEAARLFGSRLHQRYGTYVPLRQIAGAIEGLGYVAERSGQARAATLLLAAADRVRSQTAPLSPVWFAEHDRAIESLRQACGDRFELLWAEGASLSLDETLALAASVGGSR